MFPLILRLLLFTFAVTIATALIFGTVPAFRATRLQLTETLKAGRGPQGTRRKESARQSTRHFTGRALARPHGRSRTLSSQSRQSQQCRHGLQQRERLASRHRLKLRRLQAGEPRDVALNQQIEERVSALPNVKAASFSAFTFHEGSWNSNVVVPGMKIEEDINVKHNVVGTGYFATMQIPLLAGRNFSPSDTSTSQPVAIISEHTAKTLFPLGNPIGRHYGLGDDKPENDVTVIGVAKDVKFDDLAEEPVNLDYIPYTQHPWGFGDFEVRYTGDFAPVAAAVQQTIHSIDRNLPITRVTTLDEQVARSLTNQRLVAQLSAFFGLLAVFLSCIGIYGVMSYVVTRRTNEIGIRMALGAGRSNMLWMVLREILHIGLDRCCHRRASRVGR